MPIAFSRRKKPISACEVRKSEDYLPHPPTAMRNATPIATDTRGLPHDERGEPMAALQFFFAKALTMPYEGAR